MKIDWTKAAEGFVQFTNGLSERLKTLAMHGWFISADPTPLAAIYPLANLFESGRIKEGHQALCWHFGQELEKIEESLLLEFPERASILRKAFNAHNAMDFELSIPVFLAQADGIAREAIGEKIPKFSIYSKRARFQSSIEIFIKKYVEDEIISRELLKVALLAIPLNASEGDPVLNGDVLNRNAILHGTNTSYASELNSYRVLSWLEYVSYFRSLIALSTEPVLTLPTPPSSP